MTEKQLKQKILDWCEIRMKIPMNTGEAKDKLAETMDRIANNTFVPPPAIDQNEGRTMAQLQRMRDNAKNERMEMEKLMNFAKNNLDNY